MQPERKDLLDEKLDAASEGRRGSVMMHLLSCPTLLKARHQSVFPFGDRAILNIPRYPI